jgi:hypothetical protein
MDIAPCTRDIAAATWRQGYAWGVIEAVLDGSYDRYGPEPQEGVPPPVANRCGKRAFFGHHFAQKRPFCQDRLGTNTGRVEKKGCVVTHRHGDTPEKAAKRAELEAGLPRGWCVVVTDDGQAMYCPARSMVPGTSVWEMQRERPTAPPPKQ